MERPEVCTKKWGVTKSPRIFQPGLKTNIHFTQNHLLKYLKFLSKGTFGWSSKIHSNLPSHNVQPLHKRIGGIDLGQQFTRHQAKRLRDWDSLGSWIILPKARGTYLIIRKPTNVDNFFWITGTHEENTWHDWHDFKFLKFLFLSVASCLSVISPAQPKNTIISEVSRLHPSLSNVITKRKQRHFYRSRKEQTHFSVGVALKVSALNGNPTPL